LSSSKLSPHIRLMLIDDDDALRSVLRQQFEAEGLSAIHDAASAQTAFDTIDDFAPDIVLLDVQLPDGNGFDICRTLRNRGANDYIAKPMRMGELLARMNTHLRQHKLSDDARFEIQGLDFVPSQKTIASRANGTKIILTEKETMVLKMLNKNAPEAVSREALLSEIWGFQKGLTTHTLETHIYRLRQKLTRLTTEPVVETTQDGTRYQKPMPYHLATPQEPYSKPRKLARVSRK